ncbi:hypothetical protein WICMUC_004974 [Wickerhamomyces mucosus]|uniref:Golgi apyrase n=1 Tax=Wickerhamomyces mucosus TaxID=1378264 RepID=A0A9P8PDZ6_9ASCO|nr:hypothetical protein WICMUC_004974 [Wickerhamomyces mucosus]
MVKQHYGIVIDSGSSGSRIQIYRWDDSTELLKSKSTDESILRSVPKIYQEESWTYKISPGVSTFADKVDDVYDDHYEDLIEYAEKIIPKENWDDTPIFVLATAGMRLLRSETQTKLLNQICYDLQKHSHFKIENCDDQVQIIDGETEGLYGWLGLNYLFDELNDYDPNSLKHESFGFMDMGGASTQIAFVPNKDSEIEKHNDDISTIYLRNVNGDLQSWRVFVSTWLGFGANESRKRYLRNLINILPEKNNNNEEDDFNTLKLNDPCLPKNAKVDYAHLDKTYEFKGTGDYQECIKTTYPLLLKNLPCTDEPCLFNGVHAPEIDFYKDRFVGISEYWYTANDVFHMGGEYNFLKFSEHVKDFCESDWSEIEQRSANGEYNNVPQTTLVDACFKANWVLNVLHEGFNLPRVGIETTLPEEKTYDDGHIPFQSASTIKGSELSWTLGRILLYASSLIAASTDDYRIGVQPSDNEQKHFINGGLVAGRLSAKTSKSSNFFTVFSLFILLSIVVYSLAFQRSSLKRWFSLSSNFIKTKINQYRYTKVSNQQLNDLENGDISAQSLELDNQQGPTSSNNNGSNDVISGGIGPSLNSANFNIRTRSFANLQSTSPAQKSFPSNIHSQSSSNFNSQKRNGSNPLIDFGKFKRDDLPRSNSSIQ